MRRKILFLFTLLFLGLIICTMLALRVDDLMAPQVTAATTDNDYVLPLYALSADGHSGHLYRIEEGGDWTPGMYAQIMDEWLYTVEDGQLLVPGGMGPEYIIYASKPFVDGARVRVTKLHKGGKMALLAIGPSAGTLPEDKVSIEEQTDGAVLFTTSEAKLPYMEGQVRSQLSVPEDTRVFSLTELGAFLESLPRLASIGIIPIIALVGLIFAYLSLGSGSRGRKLTVFAYTLATQAALLFGFYRLTQGLLLPSSLLPERYILDLGYYRQEFSQISHALSKLSCSQAQTLKTLAGHNAMLSVIVIAAGVILCILLPLLGKCVTKLSMRITARIVSH